MQENPLGAVKKHTRRLATGELQQHLPELPHGSYRTRNLNTLTDLPQVQKAPWNPISCIPTSGPTAPHVQKDRSEIVPSNEVAFFAKGLLPRAALNEGLVQ